MEWVKGGLRVIIYREKRLIWYMKEAKMIRVIGMVWVCCIMWGILGLCTPRRC